MNLKANADRAFLSTRNLYVCAECQVVRLMTDETLKSIENQVTEKLTGTTAGVEITTRCPVCQKQTTHYHLLEAGIPNSASQAAINGLAQGVGQALMGGLMKR